MRTVRAVGALAALFLLIGTISAADEPAAPGAWSQGDSPSWFERNFGNSKPKPDEKKAAPVRRLPTREEVARSVKQQQEIYLERTKFSDKLRQIALETNDDVLRRKAEKLDNLAFEIYSRKTQDLERLMEQAKAAEKSLEDKRTWGDALGAPSQTASTAPARAPNGRPLVNRSE